MFELKIENIKGQILKLTQNESNYQVINVDGLTPPNATIYTASLVGVAGSKFKNSKVEERNLVLTIKINGDVETNRIALYNFFRISQYCKFFFKTDSRDVYIEGYVESIDGNFFTKSQEIQISIICPSPFFKDLNLITYDFSKVTPNFSFPFSIEETGKAFSLLFNQKITTVINPGEAKTGLMITLTAQKDGIENPTIFNLDTGDFFKVETVLNEKESLIINTNIGQKSVTKISNGVKENLINYVSGSSTWLQIENGAHNFTYDADTLSEDLKVLVEFNVMYEGI